MRGVRGLGVWAGLMLTGVLLLMSSSMASAQSRVYEPDSMLSHLAPGEKAAVLLVYFGTTHADAQAKVMDALTMQVRGSFPQVEVREAYSSRIVVKRLGEKGVVKALPVEALTALAKEGYTRVLVQPCFLVAGLEWQALQHDVESMRSEFQELRLATPLLFYYEDYIKLGTLLAKNYSGNRLYLLVGHGTYDASTAQYAMLDKVLAEQDHGNFVVGCIEGYPFYEQALAEVESMRPRKVTLVPFMLVFGEHGKNDILQEWQGKLKAAGYRVEVIEKGLGELANIRERFVEIVRYNLTHRRLGIVEKKATYSQTGEKLHATE